MVAKGLYQCSISLFRGVELFCYLSIERSIISPKHAGMPHAEVWGALLDGVIDMPPQYQASPTEPGLT